MTSFLETQTFNKIADPELLVAIYQHAKYNKRKTHRKTISANEKNKRDKQHSNYIQSERKNRPVHGFIFQKTPRSKITARKAQRSLLNNTKK